jgi:hypothetical protein
MFCNLHVCNIRLAFAVLALFGTTAVTPTTAEAFRVGNSVSAGRNTPLTPPNRPNATLSNHPKLFCHTVQVGNPRANPPMLVCP